MANRAKQDVALFVRCRRDEQARIKKAAASAARKVPDGTRLSLSEWTRRVLLEAANRELAA